MALIKEKTLKSGAVGNYWKIINVNYCRVTLTIHWIIALYLNETIGKARLPHLGLTKEFVKPMIYSEYIAEDQVPAGYDFIKTQSATMVTKDLSGQDITPFPFDADLAGATDSI